MWAMFLALILFLVPKPPFMNPVLFTLVPNILFIAFYYINLNFLIPQYFITKKYWTYAIICIGCLFVTMALPSAISELSMPTMEPDFASKFEKFDDFKPFDKPPKDFKHNGFIKIEFYYTFFVFAFLLALSISQKSTMLWQKVEKEKVDAELSFLKAQINPHFLFNTLNSLYAMAVTKSDQTADAIEIFSDMMRYVMDETKQEFVSLQNNIDYISNYITLQKMRLTDSVQLVYNVTGDTSGLFIAPMLLISFVENAFKYGVSTEHKSRIYINISVLDGVLKMDISNTVNRSSINDTTERVGIKNTVSRLELQYPGKYSIKQYEQDKTYYVSLKLKLK